MNIPRDLSKTILLIPCSAGKEGRGKLGLPSHSISKFLSPTAVQMLSEGREEAFKRCRLDRSSPARPALTRYSGQPYATPDVVDSLVEAVLGGLHLLVISGGYGLVRAEEPIQQYEAPMLKTFPVWRRRIPAILQDYVEQNAIERTFGVFSSQYARVVPTHLTDEDWRAVPSFGEFRGRGAALKIIPERVGCLLRDFLAQGLWPGSGWVREP